jgi:hypothetical protein
MPWASDQLPWANFKYSPPPRPSGAFEPMNWMRGPPVLLRGGAEGIPGGPPIMLPGHLSSNILFALQIKPPVMHGIGLKPYYPNRTTVPYLYNPPVVPGLTAVIQALRLKGPQ